MGTTTPILQSSKARHFLPGLLAHALSFIRAALGAARLGRPGLAWLGPARPEEWSGPLFNDVPG